MKYSNSNNFDLGIDLSFDRWLANPTKFKDEVQAEIDEKIQKSAKKKAEERQQQYLAYQKAVAEMKEYATRRQQEADNFYLQHPEEIQIGGGGSFSFANEPFTIPSMVDNNAPKGEVEDTPKLSRKEAMLLKDTEKANELGITVKELRSQRAKQAREKAERNAQVKAAEMGITVEQYKKIRADINRDKRDTREANKLGITVEQLRQQKEKEKEKRKAERKTVKAKAEAKAEAKAKTAKSDKPKKETRPERIKRMQKELRDEEEKQAANDLISALFDEAEEEEYPSENLYNTLKAAQNRYLDQRDVMRTVIARAIDHGADLDRVANYYHMYQRERMGEGYDFDVAQGLLDDALQVVENYQPVVSFNNPADADEHEETARRLESRPDFSEIKRMGGF